MKVAFVSNSFNHHQKPFCDAMYGIIGDGYSFIETRPIRKERLEMGWGQEEKPAYVRQNYISDDAKETCQKLIDAADMVLFAHGSAPDELIRNRIKSNKPVIVYSERIYKAGCAFYKLPWHTVLNYRKGYARKNAYLLCASAYSAGDFGKTMSFIGRRFKWGYFPQTKKYDLDALFRMKAENERTSILWCGRFLQWKHPEVPVLVAERLKRNGYEFEMNIIGSGAMEHQLLNMIEQNNLGDYLNLLGTMRPEEVRRHMETADIFLFTSDFNEGWGAVLNEAMNSGCAVVASHAIGAVPFLVKDGDNGFLYQNDDLDAIYDRVISLVKEPRLREKLGRSAYRTITECWNASVAAERFVQLTEDILSKKKLTVYTEGPCSMARCLSNGWYKNGKNH